MTSLTKFGSITGILQSNPPKYELQIDENITVIVSHHQIRPKTNKFLSVGTRLSVYEIDGKVKWASTDVSGSNEDEDKRIPEVEQVVCKVFEIEKTKGIVAFQTGSGRVIRIQVPVNHSIWNQIQAGQEFNIEIRHTPEGDARYKILRPTVESAAQGKYHSESQSKNTDDETSKNVGQEESIDVGRVGIDPVYFAEREKEGHRHEIMAFLTEHLNDEVIEWYQMRPASTARYAEPVKPINPLVEQAIKNSSDGKFKQLYSHQARALDSIRSGRNLIVVTQTASGKTLCYNPAIFEHFIANNKTAHALYVFPLNALMMDQKEKIDQLVNNLKGHGASINANLLIGGLGTEKRREIARSNPQILAINPELLSWILQEPQYWQDFFSNLKYVVVDEVHSYRGILGLHMANILRRLLLQTQRLGSKPQFILSSATVGNPTDLAVRLTSLPESSFDLLSEKDDGSAQAHKHWVVVNPDALTNGNEYDNYLTTAAMTMVELLTARNAQNNHSPLNTILFAKSIRDVNKVYKILQENLRSRPDIFRKVRKYISAELNSNEKREIYEGLKTGNLIGVVSTNALEAGIDIGNLDACIITGFPFSVMGMRQMAGRVGRHQEGLVVYIPQPASAIDQYYRLNQRLLLEQPPEVFVVDPSNPYITKKHVNAAAKSLSWLDQQELSIFGPRALEMVEQAIKDRVMARNGSRFTGTQRSFSNKSDSYAISGMRSAAQAPYTICKAGNGQCKMSADCMENSERNKCDSRVTILDQQNAYRDCHPGAIFEGTDGTPYRAISLDDRRHVIQVVPVAEDSLERTFAEEDVSIKIIGEPKAKKTLAEGVELYVGEVQVTRSYTGYYTYELTPKSNCRKCRREYDANVAVCPSCGRKTSRAYGQSKPKRQDFPKPYDETGFHIILKTVACWMKLPAELESKLYSASPCKLPGEKNNVADFLKRPLQIETLPQSLRLTSDERSLVSDYYDRAGMVLRKRKKNAQETLLYPGVYHQCLLSGLRGRLPEGRSLEIFQATTGYPVTNDLKHVCRKCQTSVLLQAMHTLEHTVLMRYPSVALGDISDLGSYTRLGHSGTGAPTIFWYDNYDGGLGAAEKIYEQMQDLLTASEKTTTSCSCNSLEGCPNCTHIRHCDSQNDGLSKTGLLALIALLLGKQFQVPFEPFIYRSAQKTKFESAYQTNEYARQEHGVGDEAPQGQTLQAVLDPYKVLKIQKEVHDPVLEKAYEVRGKEIMDEVPPVSAVELNQAYDKILKTRRSSEWNITAGQEPFRILEILPSASLPMIRKIYHVIARKVHPDTYSGDKAKATEMMKLVNEAFEKAQKEKKKDYPNNGFNN